MSERSQAPSVRIFDLPLLIGAGLTVIYYAIMLQPMFADSLLARYTTQHLVEYAVVSFFIWGMTDVVFHICSFPRELAALRAEWLPRRKDREPVGRAAVYLQWLEQQPASVRKSRLGRRYGQVLAELEAKGSTNDLEDYLRHLSDMDYEQTQANYALLRFQCWVMPMFGFLGTVIHFGTALSGHTAGTIGDHLAVVMSEMGTAFNTTTAALVGATSMMFAVFICERIEKGIVSSVDDRVERDLGHRFERTDADIAPFLDALQISNDQTIGALRSAAGSQAQLWMQALERLEERFAAYDQEREQRFVRILETFQEAHARQREQLEPAARQIAGCQAELSRLVGGLSEALSTRGELLSLQNQLAENLRLLRETQQIDQALHGLTGAIHLLTARAPSTSSRDSRAA